MVLSYSSIVDEEPSDTLTQILPPVHVVCDTFIEFDPKLIKLGKSMAKLQQDFIHNVSELAELSLKYSRIREFQEKYDNLKEFIKGDCELVGSEMNTINLLIGSEQCAEDIHRLQVQTGRMKEVLDYTNFGETTKFKCPLCFERDVDSFLDPCGHLVCKVCFARCADARCPACRASCKLRKLFSLS